MNARRARHAHRTYAHRSYGRPDAYRLPDVPAAGHPPLRGWPGTEPVPLEVSRNECHARDARQHARDDAGQDA